MKKGYEIKKGIFRGKMLQNLRDVYKKQYNVVYSRFNSIKSTIYIDGNEVTLLARGRYDFEISNIKVPKVLENYAKKRLGKEYIKYAGGLPSFPHSKPNEWHQDTYSLFGNEKLENKLPDFYITFLIPLQDMTPEKGLTEIRVGKKIVRPILKAGDVLILHQKTWHRGAKNISKERRDLLYIVFCKKWYNDYV